MPQRIRVSQGVSTGLLIRKVTPSYPPLAKQARIQGQVVLQAEISEDGTIQNLQLMSGHPMLAPAAIEAVRQWRYKPYLLNGELVAVVAVRGTAPEIQELPSTQFVRRRPRNVVTRSGQIDPQSAVVLTSQVTPDHTLSWQVPPGNWLLFSFIQVPTGQQVTGGAGAGTQYVLDHLSKAALQKHIDAIGEAGKTVLWRPIRKRPAGDLLRQPGSARLQRLLDRRFPGGISKVARL